MPELFTFAEANAAESHSVESSKEVLLALRIHRSLSFGRRWRSCSRICCAVGGARSGVAVRILGGLNGCALLAVNGLHDGTGRRGYARGITIDDAVRIHGDDLRRVGRLVLQDWRLRLNRSVVVRIRVAGAAVTRAVIRAEREIVVGAALAIVVLSAVMMMMRVMYAAAVLNRTRR